MDLRFLGATGTVTGSRYLLRQGEASVLVDCGLFQGYKQLRLRNRAPLPVDPRGIDAVLLTHAHIDHSGYLPLLVRNGFSGRIFCTPATEALCRILLPDSAHLQEEEADYANRHGFSRHAPALPLYTRQDVQRCLRRFHPIESGRRWAPAKGLHACFSPAGHLLGAAMLRLDDGHRSVLFSGDLGRSDDLVMAAPAPPPQADYLVVESTYGNRLHPPGDVLTALAAVLTRTAERGGAVLIPSFAVGRAQTLMYCIHLLRRQKAIPALPLYLDSPMAADTTPLYRRFAGDQRLTMRQTEAMCGAAHVVNTPEESKALAAMRVPRIILSASGMATGGRVVHHLKAMVSDRRNCILFAGHQAGGTRGASLVAGAKRVRIHGEDYPVRARIALLDQLSSHADAAGIVAWMRAMPHAPRHTFITHGEPDASDALRQRIERELGWHCSVPEHLAAVPLDWVRAPCRLDAGQPGTLPPAA